MKTSTKKIILATFMGLSLTQAQCWASEENQGQEKNTSQEEVTAPKMGLLPYFSYDFGSANVDGTSKVIGGLTIGLDYTVYRNEAFSTNSKIAFKNYSRSESVIIHSEEISGGAIVIGQSANYDFKIWDGQFQAFTQAELGYGVISSTTSNMFMGDATGSAGSLLADASVGLRYYMDNNVAPFLAAGYHHFKADKLSYDSTGNYASDSLPTEVDMSSAYVSLGVGYQF